MIPGLGALIFELLDVCICKILVPYLIIYYHIFDGILLYYWKVLIIVKITPLHFLVILVGTIMPV